MISRLVSSIALRARSPLTRRIASGFLWTMLGMAVSRGGQLLLTILVGSALGSAALGRYGVALTIALAAGQLASLGLALSATRFVAADQAVGGGVPVILSV